MSIAGRASEVSGFPLCENRSKISHHFLNLRPVQGHVESLSELLMAYGIDTNSVVKTKLVAKPDGS